MPRTRSRMPAQLRAEAPFHTFLPRCVTSLRQARRTARTVHVTLEMPLIPVPSDHDALPRSADDRARRAPSFFTRRAPYDGNGRGLRRTRRGGQVSIGTHRTQRSSAHSDRCSPPGYTAPQQAALGTDGRLALWATFSSRSSGRGLGCTSGPRSRAAKGARTRSQRILVQLDAPRKDPRLEMHTRGG